MNKKEVKIIGIVGSLREKSYNKMAILAAKDLLPDNSTLEIIEINDIPFFNEDIEKQGLPKSVIDFKNKLVEADAILIATPEYNYSVSGVLKNALDWASRGRLLPLRGKPVGIISASMGMLGGARVQYHLRQICVALDMIPINKPEVFIAKAHEKFDPNGNLIDEYGKKVITELLDNLITFIRVINKNID